MKGQTHGGKGSSPRSTNKRRFDENYEKIFNKTSSKGESQLDEGVHTPEADGRGGESKLREHVEGERVQGQTYEKQEVEPVAWRVYYESNQQYTIFQQFPDGLKHLDIQPLYTAPPKRQPLSDESVIDIARRNCGINFQYDDQIDAAIVLAHEIEKAHGIE